MTTVDSDTLLTPKQVARKLGVSVETLNVWRASKRRAWYHIPNVRLMASLFAMTVAASTMT